MTEQKAIRLETAHGNIYLVLLDWNKMVICNLCCINVKGIVVTVQPCPPIKLYPLISLILSETKVKATAPTRSRSSYSQHHLPTISFFVHAHLSLTAQRQQPEGFPSSTSGLSFYTVVNCQFTLL